MRALAFKWIRILWRCRQDSQRYDEGLYIKQLERRGSPLVERAKELAIEMNMNMNMNMNNA